MCLFFYVMIYYAKVTSKRKAREWDINTITAADYSIEYRIPPLVYHRFLELEHPER